MNETAIVVLEVIVITSTVFFLLMVIGNYLRKKAKGLPTGDCACCHKSKKKLLKEYHKCCTEGNNK